MGKSYTVLKVFLVMFCLSNIILGGMGLIGGDWAAKAASVFYGAAVDVTPQLNHVIRMLGAFVFTLGVLSGLAALDPVRNKTIIDGIILLLFIRVLQRVFLGQQIFEAFNISSGRNWLNIAFFFILALIFFMLRPRGEKS